jgi:hypothetical protein
MMTVRGKCEVLPLGFKSSAVLLYTHSYESGQMGVWNEV